MRKARRTKGHQPWTVSLQYKPQIICRDSAETAQTLGLGLPVPARQPAQAGLERSGTHTDGRACARARALGCASTSASVISPWRSGWRSRRKAFSSSQVSPWLLDTSYRSRMLRMNLTCSSLDCCARLRRVACRFRTTAATDISAPGSVRATKNGRVCPGFAGTMLVTGVTEVSHLVSLVPQS